MTSGSRLPREEFVNEPEDPPIGSVVRAATSLTNMDTRQQKIIIFAMVSIGIGSFMVGFISMFAFSESSLSMMSKLNVDPIANEDFITEEIFMKIRKRTLKENLKFFSDKPHPAGEDRDEKLADFIQDLFEDVMDHSNVDSYEVLLSYPNGENKVEMTSSNQNMKAKLNADTVNGNNFQAFNAYSAAKDVEDTAPIYVNYARYEDFKLLGSNRVKDKILIARYGKVSVAEKVRLAEEYEAKGLILYGDPKDVAPDEVPNSLRLPGDGIIRESALLSNGDPQTPSWPSLSQSKIHKVKQENLTDFLPKIPVQSIGYDDAKTILKELGGTSLTGLDYNDWRGELEIDYKLGGETMQNGYRLHLETTNQLVKKEIKNVVGIIEGHVEPDRYVIIGSHRDSMAYGAIDPSSGTSVLVHVAVAINRTMMTHGWRPRRSLVFVSFSGSEFGHIGAQEWLEQHLPKFKNRVVSYINIDGCVSGNHIDATASIPLKKIIIDSMKNIPDPIQPENYLRTYYDLWKEEYSRFSEHDEPYVNHLGYNGDYIPFAYQAGIPSIDLRFIDAEHNISRIYPTRGTGYDNLQYYEKFDKDAKFLETCSQVLVYLIRQLSDSLILPFDIEAYSEVLNEAYRNIRDFSEQKMEEIEGVADSDRSFQEHLDSNDVSFDLLKDGIDDFKKQAEDWEKSLETLDKSNPIVIRMLNDQMMQLEKVFLAPTGHVIFSPKHNSRYGQAIFPGLVNLLQEFNHLPTQDRRDQWEETGWEYLKRNVTEIYVCIVQATSLLKPLHNI